ncbi:CPCC family cysteine-rich protein [Lacibacterium aquatile]|uniref:CPCC family cysteine-rich protein n=1 Tax=Lacibacterium aquatile TaxID=1168082 RepID=A0ABW5DM87_9PROT
MGRFFFRNNSQPSFEGYMHRCPCCQYRTLEQRGIFELCGVCFLGR